MRYYIFIYVFKLDLRVIFIVFKEAIIVTLLTIKIEVVIVMSSNIVEEDSRRI